MNSGINFRAESRKKKKDHVEALEDKVSDYEHRFNRVYNITANLKSVLQSIPLPKQTNELLEEIQKLSTL